MNTDVTEMPVRGSNAIEILVNDHQTIKQLLERLVEGPETDRQMVVEQLQKALTIHNATEENLVYPALNAIAGKKFESRWLYHETAEADMLLFKIDTGLKTGAGDETYRKQAEKLRDAILEHIDDEEQKAFVHLQDGADQSQTDLLTQSVRKFRQSLHFNGANS